MGGITTAEQAVTVLLGLRSRYRSRGEVAAAEVLQRAIVVVRAQIRPSKESQPAADTAASPRKETP